MGINYNSILQSLATSGNGSAMSINRLANVTVHVTGAGVISGGTVKVEEAETEDYAGTWNEIETIDATLLNGGAMKTVRCVGGIYGFVRARISSAIIGGGTISATAKATD
jgi:hypothetical protein